MINIIINSDILAELQKQGYHFTRTPYKKYETVIAKEGRLSEEITKIIKDVENCHLDNNGNVISKFTNTPISLNSISEGSKTIIYVYFRTKLPQINEIINITSCGPNAIEYILKNYNHYNLTLYLGHLEFPNDLIVDFKLNNTLIHSTNDIFE
mgnify:CR=1 FL=1